jgi:hypothetical protein
MLFQGRKTGDKIKFRGYDDDKYKAFLERYQDGTWFNIKITKAQKHKTAEQLGYYYAVILPVINRELINLGHTMTVCGVQVPIDEKQTDKVIKYFCSRLDEDNNIVLHDIDNHPSRKVMYKRNMGREHASQFIDNVIKWAATNLGCRIPEAKRE